jgi:serine/threonine protein kinase
MATMRANLESLNIGDTFLTKYEIRGLIGRGGQATVYRSYDTFIDRDVAIKVMADAFDTKREHSRRAQMEARVLCRLHHPNIVHVYDAGSTDTGAIYIIMELLRGRTLRDILRELRNLTVYEALSVGAQIADGVEVAHGQQVIHRDLKPENVFIVEGNAVKVLDFGIAKFLTLTGITTQRDTLQGTMWYISPEHVQGHGVTPRSDIYALGSILYEAISGTPPCLVGLKEVSTQSVAWSQITRVPPQLDEINPTVPGYVARLIQRMLAKDPNERPSSMAGVAEALRDACQRLQTESDGAVAVARELWNDQSSESPAGSLPQPTVELLQDHIQANSQPALAQHAAGVTPESGIVADAEPIRPSANRSQVSSVPFFSNRKRVLATALALGTVFGVGLGVSNRSSSKFTTSQSASSSQSASEVHDKFAASLSVTRDSYVLASRPDAAAPSVVAATRSPLASSSATANTTSSPRTKLQSIPVPQTSKKPPVEAKPRYSVDDLE